MAPLCSGIKIRVLKIFLGFCFFDNVKRCDFLVFPTPSQTGGGGLLGRANTHPLKGLLGVLLGLLDACRYERERYTREISHARSIHEHQEFVHRSGRVSNKAQPPTVFFFRVPGFATSFNDFKKTRPTQQQRGVEREREDMHSTRYTTQFCTASV